MKKIIFLFGSRSTGKSSLIKAQLSDSAHYIDLLGSEYYLRLRTTPQELEQIIFAHGDPTLVVIDEIQRVPMLLNEVHRLIANHKVRFLLTGSSAWKLKKTEINLLAGRAWTAELFPLCYHEIPDFNLARYLQFGGLPTVYLSDFPEEELGAYIGTYLREEIQAEAVVRKIPASFNFYKRPH